MASETDKSKLSALFQILQATTQISAQAVFYVSALGAILLIGTSDPSSAFSIVAGGLGVNLLSNMLERIAQGHTVSDEEIRSAVQKAIEDSNIAELLTADEFQRTVAKLVRKQEHLKFAVENQEYVLVDILGQQYQRYTAFLEELRPALAAIYARLQTLATRDQAEQIISLLDRIRKLIEGTSQVLKPSWDSLLIASASQVKRAIKGLSRKYQHELYVAREAEAVFQRFLQSDKVCIALVDRAGCGKTNLLCGMCQRF